MDALLSKPDLGRFALTALLLVVAPVARAQATAEPIEDLGYVDPSVAAAVFRARTAALRKLVNAQCRQLFAEFTDLAGVPLDRVLEDLGDTAERHLRRMAFLDGSRMHPCRRRDVYAFTEPGSLSVLLCRSFGKLTARDASSAANLLLHEMLHSLGAGEAPSTGLLTAYEITDRVESRCGR